MSHLSKYSTTNPQWAKFVSEYPDMQDLDKVGIIRRREIFTQIEALLPAPELPQDVTTTSTDVRNFHITGRDGYQIPVRSYVPVAARATGERPVLVYLHAGGFLFGDLESGELNCRVIASRLNISVLNVGYRLAPRWKFPYGLHDSYDAVEWVASNANKELKASPNAGFLVGGISSGANFAAVIAYQSRDAALSPPITGLWISIPVALMPQAYQVVPQKWKTQLLSLDQNAENPLLTKTSLLQIQELYGVSPTDPNISFLLQNNHEQLPRRIYLQICGADPLRDEAFLWQQLLHKHSGTEAQIDLYTGLPHGFWRFRAMEASKQWLNDLTQGITFAINGGSSRHASTAGLQVEGAVVAIKGL